MNVMFTFFSLLCAIIPSSFASESVVIDGFPYTINSVLKKVSVSDQLANSNFNTAAVSEAFELEFKEKGISNRFASYRLHRKRKVEFVYRINLVASAGVLVTKYFAEELDDEWLELKFELFITDPINKFKCQMTLTYLIENFVKNTGDGYNEINYLINLSTIQKYDTYLYLTKNEELRASNLQISKQSANFTCNDYYYNEVLNTTSLICSMEYAASSLPESSHNIAIFSIRFPLRFQGPVSKNYFLQFSVSFILRTCLIAVISIALLIFFTGYIMINEKDFHHYVVLSHQLTALKTYICNNDQDDEAEDLLKQKQGKVI